MGYMSEKHIEVSERVKEAYILLMMVHGDVLNHIDGDYDITKAIAADMSENLDYITDVFEYDLFPWLGIDEKEAFEEFEKRCQEE